jgi:hypothetical protein
MTGLRDDIRKLHEPHWYRSYRRPAEQVWPVCGGCDEGAHAETPSSWPCSTAGLVYTPAEIAPWEPQVPECPENHRAQAIFIRRADGRVEAARFMCDHVAAAATEWTID